MYALVTCPPGREGDAILEIEWALGRVRVHGTRWRGVLLVETPLEPAEAVRKLLNFETQAIQRFVPLDAVVPLEELTERTLGLLDVKGVRGKFAVRARVRGGRVSPKDIEVELGSRILERFPGLRVDLSSPDWIVVVEVMDNKAGVGVFEPACLLRLEAAP